MPQSNEYQVIARRYRPKVFAEVFGQDAIVTTLKNAILHRRLAHAYLFCGSRGTGKTTLARLFAKTLNCQAERSDQEPCNTCSSCQEIMAGASLDILEIDGASHRGIDDIREINDTVSYAASSGKYKIYIIDEVHMLTKEAFNALLKTLEEPPAHVKFLFATTEPHKVPSTILSRCQRFNLQRLPLEKILQKLSYILKEQQMEATPEALRLIANHADGGMRDAESLLDQILAFHERCIDETSVANLLGIVSRELFFKLDQAGKEGNFSVAFEIAHQIFSQGKDLPHFVHSLTEHFRTLLLVKLGGPQAPYLALSAVDREKYLISSKFYSQEQCLTILDFLMEALDKIRFMPSGRVALEALLLRILRIHQRVPVDILVRQLMELKQDILKLETKVEDKSVKPVMEIPEPKKVKAVETSVENRSVKTAIKTSKLQEIEAKPKEALDAISMTEDPTPSAQDLGIPNKSKKTIQSNINKPIIDVSKQSRYDTLLHFAAVELEGSLQKKAIKGV